MSELQSAAPPKKRLAVFKFASCDGCQLSLLDLEDYLLELADSFEIAYFREATSLESQGPFDIALADGSITTREDAERLRSLRERTTVLVALGACATAGGIQALRNFADIDEYKSLVYPRPEYLNTLATSTAFSEHVAVDFELRGCPIHKRELLELLQASLAGRKPTISHHSVCIECKTRGSICVMVTGTPCLGPITHAGCGAICPSYQRGCYGCFGPSESANTASMSEIWLRASPSKPGLVRALRTFNSNSPLLAAESKRHE